MAGDLWGWVLALLFVAQVGGFGVGSLLGLLTQSCWRARLQGSNKCKQGSL